MSKKKILVVDDSNTILLMERMMLSRDYDVITAKDGADAVLKANGDSPDLILLDVMMPRMNGFEACKVLKTQDNTKHIPIIMVTTRGEEPSVESGFSSGCNDYVTKPINNVELLSKVRNFLGE